MGVKQEQKEGRKKDKSLGASGGIRRWRTQGRTEEPV